jgi:hypothetical protein
MLKLRAICVYFEINYMGSSSLPTKLERGFQAAIEETNNICVLKTYNRFEDIINTNGWPIFLRSRYSTLGRYYNSVRLPASDKNKTYRVPTPENFIQNKRYDPNHNDSNSAWVLPSFKWYYHIVDHSIRGAASIDRVKLSDKDPLADKQFNLTQAQIDLLGFTILARAMRSANCGIRADLIAEYLWRNAAELGIFRIEVVRMTVDHNFVIVNRAENSELNQPRSWGDAWVVDGWVEQGIFFPAKTFNEGIRRIKEFLRAQSDKLKTINLATRPLTPQDKDLKNVKCEIRPAIHKYPVYPIKEAKHPVQQYVHQYYASVHEYPEMNYLAFIKSQEPHKEHFKKCLSELKNNEFKLKMVEKKCVTEKPILCKSADKTSVDRAINRYTDSNYLYLFSSNDSFILAKILKDHFVPIPKEHENEKFSADLGNALELLKRLTPRLGKYFKIIKYKVSRHISLSDVERYQLAQAYVKVFPKKNFSRQLVAEVLNKAKTEEAVPAIPFQTPRRKS